MAYDMDEESKAVSQNDNSTKIRTEFKDLAFYN
jgi:hypothetical protein